MEHGALQNAEKYTKAHQRKKRWYRVVTGMACVVVFCTVYALILPAITLEKEGCGIPEHTHTQECYTQVTSVQKTVPVCNADRLSLHRHTPDCYDVDGDQICAYADFVVHQHDASCYDESGKLWCPLPEIKAHTHDDGCYAVPGAENAHTHSGACYTLERGSLICTEHMHTEDCYTEITKLVCGQEESDGHRHSEGCMDEAGAPVCGLEVSDGHHHDASCYETGRELTCGTDSDHQHTDDCYAWEKRLICELPTEPEENAGQEAEPVLICEKEEVILHTHQPYVSPEDPGCYDKQGHLVCGQVQVLAHQHTAACFDTVEEPADTQTLTCALPEDENHTHTALCYGTWVLTCGLEEHIHSEACTPADPEPVYVCGKEAHTHTETCYDEAGELTCGLEEHTHSEECQGTAVSAEEEQAKVQELITLIDALPTPEEVEQRLTELEDAEDEDGYNAFFQQISLQARTAYAYYEDLPAELQEQVTNREKLLELSWLWSAQTLEITASLTVYQVNSYSQAVTTVVYGGSVREKLGSGMSFKYWDIIVVEEDSSGRLYAAQYITADEDKRDYSASTSNGFVILLYNTATNVTVGDTVSVSFDYKTTAAYSSSGHGTVTFSTPAQHQLKPDKDNSGQLTIIPGADTRDLIEVNLYDYGANINDKYNSDNKYPGFQQEFGSRDVGTQLSRWASFNFGNNITSDLDAGRSDLTNQGGAINTTTNGANSPISGAMQSTLGADGYPALSDGTSLSYLFSNNPYAVKKNNQSINGLFQYNATTGAYTFNSRENHAQFNAGSDTFTLYRQMLTPNFMMYPFGNFLPFNDIVHVSAQTSTIDRAYLQTIADSALYKEENGYRSEYNVLGTQLNAFVELMDTATGGTTWKSADAMNKYFELSGIPKRFTQDEELLQNLYSLDYDEPTDFYFGMEMKMKFIQPKDGLTGNDTNQDGVPDYPMVFDFSGDDDVWVYVDGKLFLDLSGIHRHVGGKIDFQQGKVYYYSLDVSIGDVSATPYKTVNFSELVSSGLNENGTFENYSTHDFNFYYMERGSGSGVCRMNFNFPFLRRNAIHVKKQVSIDDQTIALLGNPDFRFQVFKGDVQNELFIGENVAYKILDQSGTEIGEGTTDSNGVFTLKANQTAVFENITENSGTYFVRELLEPDVFGQYGKIDVDGSTQTESNNVTVGSDEFKGVDSPVKDMSDGSTTFAFNNNVDPNKLGKLSITKTLTAADGVQASGPFDFSVTLDGSPLPVGTVYSVGTETRAVETEGIISLAPGDTATISNILAGSRFTVAETAESAQGYVVTYIVDGGNPAESASGVIKTQSTVAVVCNNSEPFASVNIPVQKNLQFPDGKEHDYTIHLEQVTDQSGLTAADPAFTRELPVKITSDPVNAAFRLDYPQSSLSTLPQTFYYRITEQVNSAEIGTVFDTSGYVVAVTVDASFTASITGVWKDGSPIDLGTPLSFNNTIVHYELPDTGGAGTLPYTAGGLLLMAAAVILLYSHTKRRKEDFPSS